MHRAAHAFFLFLFSPNSILFRLFNSLEHLFLELRYCLMNFARLCSRSLRLWKEIFSLYIFLHLFWIACWQNVLMALGVNVGGFAPSTPPGGTALRRRLIRTPSCSRSKNTCYQELSSKMDAQKKASNFYILLNSDFRE